MFDIRQEKDRTITYMCHPSIRLFQLYREHRANGGAPRDAMQYTDENEELRAAFNAEMGTDLDRKDFWVHVQRELKKGENNIQAYLDREKIE